jgi:hypothetical protein
MFLPLTAALAVRPRTAVPNGLVRHLDWTVQELRDRGVERSVVDGESLRQRCCDRNEVESHRSLCALREAWRWVWFDLASS